MIGSEIIIVLNIIAVILAVIDAALIAAFIFGMVPTPYGRGY